LSPTHDTWDCGITFGLTHIPLQQSVFSPLVLLHINVCSVEMHTSLGAHILTSVHPNSFVLLSTATHTQPARELPDVQLGTPDRVLRRSRMSSYSLSLFLQALQSLGIASGLFGLACATQHSHPHQTRTRALQCTAWYTQ